jgi:hypothetical protein
MQQMPFAARRKARELRRQPRASTIPEALQPYSPPDIIAAIRARYEGARLAEILRALDHPVDDTDSFIRLTRELDRYVSDLRALPNECARNEYCAQLLGALTAGHGEIHTWLNVNTL